MSQQTAACVPSAVDKKQSDLMRSDDLARGVTGDRSLQDGAAQARTRGPVGRSSRCTDGDHDGVVS